MNDALRADLTPTVLAAELKQRFGSQAAEVVCDILRGRDLLAIMPTGGGQFVALIRAVSCRTAS